MDEQSNSVSPDRITLDKLAFRQYVSDRLPAKEVLTKTQAAEAACKAVEGACAEMDGSKYMELTIHDHVFHWCVDTGIHEEPMTFPFGSFPLKDIIVPQVQRFLLSICNEALHANEYSSKTGSIGFVKTKSLGQGYLETIKRIEDLLTSCKYCEERISLVDVMVEPDGSFTFFFKVILDTGDNYHHITVVVPCRA